MSEAIAPQPDSALQHLLAACHRAAGAPVYLVGGALRDLLSGRAANDIDLLVAGDVAACAGRIAESVGGHAFVLDEPRQQYRVILGADASLTIDLSRLEGAIEYDLLQRDFTVNAMAAIIGADGSLGPLLDPSGGLKALRTCSLSMVAEANLKSDPLRLLRAVRLAAELDFIIDDEAAAAISRHAALLSQAAAERQRDELCRILATNRAGEALRKLDALGLLAQLIPELMAAHGVEQPLVHHYWDVFDHSIETVCNLDRILDPADSGWLAAGFRQTLAWEPLNGYLASKTGAQERRVLLKLAGLLHDVSKPETKTTEADGRIRFFGHPEQGAFKAEAICHRLRFSRQEGRFVALLVEEHLRPTQLSQAGMPSDRAIYRFFRDLGVEDAAPACLILTLADAAAAAGPRLQPQRWQGMVAYMNEVLARGSQQARQITKPRLITGDDLISHLHLTPGPLLGRLLGAIDEAIATGEVSDRDATLALASKLLREEESPQS